MVFMLEFCLVRTFYVNIAVYFWQQLSKVLLKYRYREEDKDVMQLI